MIIKIITLLIVFLVGSFDEIPVLIAFFSMAKRKRDKNKIIIGFTIGHMMLVFISILIAKLLGFIPRPELIGLTGLIPLIIGIKALITLKDKTKKIDITASIFSIVIMTLGMGGDDLGVYIPLFTTMKNSDLLLVIPVYFFGTLAQLYFTKWLTEIKGVKKFTRKYTKLIVGFIFIILGIYIMLELGTIKWIVGLL